MFEGYNHLGFYNPYYFIGDKDVFVISRTFKDIVNKYSNKLTWDVSAVIQLLNSRFIYGDRTLIRNIYKTPWMAHPSKNGTSWIYGEVPSHSEKDIIESEIATKLFDLIADEIINYIQPHKNIGVLLSGGMDSRIVAGTIDYLIKTKQVSQVNVCALTWGNDNSRDVVYAKEISKRLGWDWKHYRVNADHLLTNIAETARHGCEYSPIHLHALPQIRDENEFDCVLAGSYGDSIGRAEYSGIKVRRLKALDLKFKNFGGIVKSTLYQEFNRSGSKDIEVYHDAFPQSRQYQQFELDYQLHYMRRMLNPCMDLISEKMPFYQVFTKPSVVNYMWSIKPERRNDSVYRLMFDLFETKLDDIPWARTGLPYSSTEGNPDKYTKEHHSYSRSINDEIYPILSNAVVSESLNKTGIFNMDAIESLCKLVKNLPHHNFDYLERLMWLAALSKFVTMFEINNQPETPLTLFDKLNSSLCLPAEYLIKYSYRRFLK